MLDFGYKKKDVFSAKMAQLEGNFLYRISSIMSCNTNRPGELSRSSDPLCMCLQPTWSHEFHGLSLFAFATACTVHHIQRSWEQATQAYLQPHTDPNGCLMNAANDAGYEYHQYHHFLTTPSPALFKQLCTPGPLLRWIATESSRWQLKTVARDWWSLCVGGRQKWCMGWKGWRRKAFQYSELGRC